MDAPTAKKQLKIKAGAVQRYEHPSFLDLSDQIMTSASELRSHPSLSSAPQISEGEWNLH